MKHRATGFTLLEVMVVVVVIGVLASFVRLAIGDGGRASRLRDTARLVQQLTTVAAQEAVLSSRPIALVVTGNQFQLQELRDGDWHARDTDALFRVRNLPAGVELVIAAPGRDAFEALSMASPAIFFPDGTAETLAMELRDPGVSARVRLAPEADGYRVERL